MGFCTSLSSYVKLIIFIIFYKFKMKLKEFISVSSISSMAPNELKISKELNYFKDYLIYFIILLNNFYF